MSAEQLPLDLRLRPALGRDAFVAAPSNAEALALVEAPRWPQGKIALSGPEASGKTHLAHAWAIQSGGVVVPADQLARLDMPTVATARRVAVEDVPAIAGNRRAEAALFHLHNLLLSDGGRLMVTGREAPARWGISLPDLASRLAAATLARLGPPDDALLEAILKKQFADRRLDVRPRVLPYLLVHMSRTAAAARTLAEEIDRLSLVRRKPVTLPLAREALVRLGHAPAPPDDLIDDEVP